MDQANPHKRKVTHTKMENRRRKKAKSTRCTGCLSRTCASKNNCGMFLTIAAQNFFYVLKSVTLMHHDIFFYSIVQLPIALHQICYVIISFFLFLFSFLFFQIPSQCVAAVWKWFSHLILVSVQTCVASQTNSSPKSARFTHGSVKYLVGFVCTAHQNSL